MALANGRRQFLFKIRTRSGPVVDRITVSSHCEEEALKRLEQIYPGCQVLGVVSAVSAAANGRQCDSFDSIIDLITNDD